MLYSSNNNINSICYLIQNLFFESINTLKLHFQIKCTSHHNTPSCCLSAVANFLFVLVSCEYKSVKMPRGGDDNFSSSSLCLSLSVWKDNSESCLFVRPVSSH